MLAPLTPRADILEVISNLSSDEVFTPPPVANAVLDLLPEEVWSDPSLRWLDPGTKTGVFLREAARRLMKGLEGEIPDENKRREHILNNMLFGAAITELTALMARRSLYCSKEADGEKSIIRMRTPDGNIFFQRVGHSFDKGGRCTECGAREETLERGAERENYAYAFIHEDGRNQISEVMDMQFDVIVGNPPYQLDIGDTSDVPLYDKFVLHAMALEPKYISFVIPSRWMQGGKSLGGFRELMLTDKRVATLVDFAQMSDVFPGAVDFEGGVCYFLWDATHKGKAECTFRRGDVAVGPIKRDLSAFDVHVRDPRALSIVEKVVGSQHRPMSELVSGQTPFGLTTNFKGYRTGRKQPGDLTLYLSSAGERLTRAVPSSSVTKGRELIDHWKLLVPMAYGERGKLPARVLGPTSVAGPKSVCTQTFLALGPFASQEEAKSIESYLRTRFARFMISLRKIAQHNMKAVWMWLPIQEWDREWSDDQLYRKYKITKSEQAYIQEMVKEIAE